MLQSFRLKHVIVFLVIIRNDLVRPLSIKKSLLIDIYFLLDMVLSFLHIFFCLKPHLLQNHIQRFLILFLNIISHIVFLLLVIFLKFIILYI